MHWPRWQPPGPGPPQVLNRVIGLATSPLGRARAEKDAKDTRPRKVHPGTSFAVVYGPICLIRCRTNSPYQRPVFPRGWLTCISLRLPCK